MIHHLAPVLAAIHAQRRQVIRRQHVRHFEIRVRRVGVQHERIVGLAQKSGVLPVRHIAAGVADGPRQQHVRRHVAIRPFQFRQHAADVRILHAALEQPAGLHHLVPRVVYRGGRMIDAADQRIFVGVLRHARKILGNLDARNVGLDRLVRPANLNRRVGLHVPGVELRRPAHQEQHDAVGVFLRIDGAQRLHGEQVVEAQAEHRQRAGVQKIAPPQAIAELDRFVGIQPKHPDPPLREVWLPF